MKKYNYWNKVVRQGGRQGASLNSQTPINAKGLSAFNQQKERGDRYGSKHQTDNKQHETLMEKKKLSILSRNIKSPKSPIAAQTWRNNPYRSPVSPIIASFQQEKKKAPQSPQNQDILKTNQARIYPFKQSFVTQNFDTLSRNVMQE